MNDSFAAYEQGPTSAFTCWTIALAPAICDASEACPGRSVTTVTASTTTTAAETITARLLKNGVRCPLSEITSVPGSLLDRATHCCPRRLRPPRLGAVTSQKWLFPRRTA